MASAALWLIGELYAIEEQSRRRTAPDRPEAWRNRSCVVVNRIWAWCELALKDPAPTLQPTIRKAILYAVGRKASLKMFLADPDVLLSPNLVENTLRSVNLGAGSIGIINGPLATCRMQDVDPRRWLTHILLRIDTHPAERVDDPRTSDIAPAGVLMPQPTRDRSACDNAGR